MRALAKMDEEVARWAFEVHLRSVDGCDSVFSNPTAGPWKRVMSSDELGDMHEVHRFARDEARPDLVLVSDEHRTVLIIEAKDELAKLAQPRQARKSAHVAVALASILRSRQTSPGWARRASYDCVLGLLWGASTPSTGQERQAVFHVYAELLSEMDGPIITSRMLGIECLRLPGSSQITCAAFGWESEARTSGGGIEAMLDSVGLESIHRAL